MILWISVSAAVGGIASGLLGYLGSHSGFSFAKFLPTIIRAVIAGAGVALASPFLDIYATSDFGIGAALIAAFLVGAGVDVAGHRIAGVK